jgi:O-antigen ligase
MSVMAKEPLRARFPDRERLARVADGLVVAVAVSLPWSTSATGILVVAWLLVLIPTLEPAALRRELTTPAGALPVALWGLAVIGMLWADVPLSERLAGLGSFHKLLVIPLLMAQFRRSGRGSWVLFGFLVSCGVLLVVSFVLVLMPGLTWRGKMIPGVPVKDYISQGTLFSVCVVLLADLALAAWQKGRRSAAVGCAVLAAMFLANVVYVLPSRTPLVVIPVLFLVFVFRRCTLEQSAGLLAAAAVALVAAWSSAPVLRNSVYGLYNEIHLYRTLHVKSRSGERLEFWNQSLGFMREAPVIGHGTGSITDQFRKAVAGKVGVWAQPSTNPHNQVLAVGIQLGLFGVAVLFAMWIALLLLFRGEQFAAFAGLFIVAQNIVGSLFNSHLFDFTQGWFYVIGVGVAAGVVRRIGAKTPPAQ